MHGSRGLGLPSVAVVVPAYNEERRIADTLRRLLDQEYPDERYDVVVVDNGSRDLTPSIVRQCGVRLLVEAKPSSYAARNRGIRETQSEYLAFIDSDCLADRAWLSNLMHAEQSRGAGLVAGRIELLPPKQRTMGSAVVLSRYSADGRRQHVESNGTAAAGNLLVKRDLFDQLGLFEECVSGADTVFTKAAADVGRRVVYAEDAVVWHPSDISNWGLLRRTFRVRYGAGIRARGAGTRPLQLLRGVPWRPPIRFPPEMRPALKGWNALLDGVLWRGYLWAENLAGWLGLISGYVGVRYKGDRR